MFFREIFLRTSHYRELQAVFLVHSLCDCFRALKGYYLFGPAKPSKNVSSRELLYVEGRNQITHWDQHTHQTIQNTQTRF